MSSLSLYFLLQRLSSLAAVWCHAPVAACMYKWYKYFLAQYTHFMAMILPCGRNGLRNMTKSAKLSSPKQPKHVQAWHYPMHMSSINTLFAKVCAKVSKYPTLEPWPQPHTWLSSFPKLKMFSLKIVDFFSLYFECTKNNVLVH